MSELLRQHPFFEGIDHPLIDVFTGCAANVHFRAGEALFREGEAANAFYLMRRGRVALQVHRPAGGAITLDTVDPGEVIGWSWIVPPYRWLFDAVAIEPAGAVVFDATCLRAACDRDPAAGYALLRKITQVMEHRLQAARLRLLDLYGDGVA
jgi:CRP-like cAMP-binding protein